MSMKNDQCCLCSYTRQKCAKCGIGVDEGMWCLNQVLCKPCASPPPPPKPAIYSSTRSAYDLPPDSPGCYRQDICKGHCTCDSTY